MEMNQYTPLYIFLLSFSVLVIVSYFAYGFGIKMKLKGRVKTSPIITPSVLGLLSLILSFSFSMSISRYEERRKLVIQEANAIQTAYLRAMILKPVPGYDIKKMYLNYLNTRIKFYEAQDLEKEIQFSVEEQKELWNHYKKVTEKDRSAVETLYAYALNPMIDVATARNYTLMRTLPIQIYGLTLLIAMVGFSCLNFDRGFKNEENHWSTGITIALFCVIFTFVYDIDHSREGMINISQDAMYDIRDFIQGY